MASSYVSDTAARAPCGQTNARAGTAPGLVAGAGAPADELAPGADAMQLESKHPSNEA
jgi:hypothetical protein